MTTIIAYVLIASFFILEGRLRQGHEAKTLETTEADRGSTRRIGAAFGTCILLMVVAPILNALSIGKITWHPTLLGWSGVVLVILCLALRVWAARVLGAYYTRTLRVSSDQHIVQQGPYRLIRHPGYLADIFLWIGGGLAVLNWIVLIVMLVIVPYAYIYRVRTEEAMLAQAFGDEFTAYRAKTWRLIPLIY
ncbi:MAG TPA: isoprenylcysteine carboxylmethyltransferase family protein [Aggregatilineales bacterium]|nr:isoprenylcysteine carboxylmethyltransferase family protein [Aggregatilineales bacterium]